MLFIGRSLPVLDAEDIVSIEYESNIEIQRMFSVTEL